MNQFNVHDSDSLVLADIRELLFIIADDAAGTYATGGARKRFTDFVADRMTSPRSAAPMEQGDRT